MAPLTPHPAPSVARQGRWPPAPSDRDLIARVRDGDEGAFETLFTEHYAALCDFVRSLVGTPEVAEDVVQSAFLGVWSRRHTWDPTDGARAYLFTVCRSRALDHLRHQQVLVRKATQIVVAARAELAERREVPGAALESEELHAQLSRAVHALPERRRLVVILRWQHQLTNAEIARVLGISEKGVETQFGRALAGLRKRFARSSL
ncbi:MAG: RNA polymerase sigma-70 factor [Gemmatimonadaceae bacterium]|nr:RNA polymerase sigma-70 factor [Gemmatimonadaceae bacterium]MBA3557701.1 RNA polymerase sigma-70 factor [Gemmatimonadaceae bacterium]